MQQKLGKKRRLFLSKLKGINSKELVGTSAYYTYLLLKEILENKQDSRICKEELWNINPVFGWHNIMASVAAKQPVGTAENRELALERWQTFETVVNDQIDNLQRGLSMGYTAPKPVVVRVLAQLNMMLDCEIERSPFYDFARRDQDDLFRQNVVQLIENNIIPALHKYIQYLEQNYLPYARESIGLSALPNGKDCYLAKIRQETSLSLTPKEIHQLGLGSVDIWPLSP